MKLPASYVAKATRIFSFRVERTVGVAPAVACGVILASELAGVSSTVPGVDAGVEVKAAGVGVA